MAPSIFTAFKQDEPGVHLKDSQHLICYGGYLKRAAEKIKRYFSTLLKVMHFYECDHKKSGHLIPNTRYLFN